MGKYITNTKYTRNLTAVLDLLECDDGGMCVDEPDGSSRLTQKNIKIGDIDIQLNENHWMDQQLNRK